jgi:hypothetical protein
MPGSVTSRAAGPFPFRLFHEEPIRETPNATLVSDDAFAQGLLLGVLIGEGHFGGDRLQAQVTLKLHERRKPLLDWLLDRCPGARLYGPYEYENRRFYQLMVRGNALRYRLIPLLDALPWPDIDPHTYERYAAMKRRYGLDTVEAPG